MFEYIDINGKKMPIKFGFNALRHFSRRTGTTINDMERLGTNMNFDHAICLIHCGLMDGARVAKEKFVFTEEDLADALDSDMDIIERAMTVFTDQLSQKDRKKKQTKKKKA